MKKRIFSALLAAVMLFSFIGVTSPILAKTTKQKLNEKKKEINRQQKAYESSSDQASSLKKQVASYDEKIKKINADLTEKEKKKAEVEKELSKAEAELKRAKKKKEKYQALFKKRMQIMYMYGETGYLDTIFSSDSITDLVSSVSAVKELVTYDQKIIEELKSSERIIKVKTEEIAQKESDLKVAISELNQDKDDIRALQVAKEKQLTDTNDDIKNIREQINMLERERRELSDQLYKEKMAKSKKYKKKSKQTVKAYGKGNKAIVKVARSQLGNSGGRRYWSWFGFRYRVSWCACFVSWCANECGYIRSGAVPKFSYVDNGAYFFRRHGRWHGRNYRPKKGDIIFFDWDGNGVGNHVGIVSSCSGGTVHTIEGNSGDRCRRRSYSVGSWCILGYGHPKY